MKYTPKKLLPTFGSLLVALFLINCSGSEQDQNELEVSQQENPAEEGSSEEAPVDDGSLAAQDDTHLQDDSEAENMGNSDFEGVSAEASAEAEMEETLKDLTQEAASQEESNNYDSMAMENGSDVSSDMGTINDQNSDAESYNTDHTTNTSFPESSPMASTSVPQDETPPTNMNKSHSNNSMHMMNNEDAFTYIIQPGDTLSKISQKVYGDLSNWRSIAENNQMENPNMIMPGDELKLSKINDQSRNFAQNYENTQTVEVVVEKGDTLSKIAENHFGLSSAWRYIWKANQNHISNPNKIFVGQVFSFKKFDLAMTH